MKNRYIHIFSFVAALLMLATFSACEADDKIEFVTGTTTEPESELNKENGHEWVDLGLSVKWATCNVGASRPEQYGNYYAWGETTTKSEYTRDNSKTMYKNLGDISGNAQYDAARANWGGSWRMPRKAEFDELRKHARDPNQMTVKTIYADIDLDANAMESELQWGFEELLWFVNQYLETSGKGSFNDEDVEVIFNRDGIVNESEIMQMLVSAGVRVSNETLLSMVPWVDNIKEEVRRVKKEEQEQINLYGDDLPNEGVNNGKEPETKR